MSFLDNVQSNYNDKRLEYFLDKNLKYVVNAFIEAGDPIIYKSKSNLFINDFREMEDDPWDFIEKQQS